MVWNPANDFMAGYQFGEGIEDRRLEQERETRYRDALPGLIKNAYGLSISPEDVEASFDGEAPDMNEMASARIEEEFGDDAEFLGFEPADDGGISRVRFRRSPDSEPENYTLEGDDLLMPNDPGVGAPDTEALKAVFDYNPEVGMQLLEAVQNRRAKQRERTLERRRRGLLASVLEQQAGVDEQRQRDVNDVVDLPDRVAIDRGSVGQDGAPSLEAAANMPRNRRQPGARTSPAAPPPEVPEGRPLESAASRTPAAPLPSARRNEAPALNGELDENQAAFVQSIWSDAERTARELGVPTEAVVAQAALESGWGQSAPGNNLFGIKGEGQRLPTEEVVNGQRRDTEASFRAYDSRAGAFQDLQSVLNNERYADARGAQTPGEYGAALQSGGYATDPEYGAKIEAVADTIRSGMSLPDGDRGRNPQGLNAIATPSYEQDIPTNPSAPTSLSSVVGDTGYRLGQGLNRVIGAGRATVDDLTDVVGSVGDTLAEGAEGFRDGVAGQQRSSEPSGRQTGGSGRQPAQQPEQSGEPRQADRPRQAQTSTGRFTINAGDAQGGNERVDFKLPSQRQVDRLRAQARQQIRKENASSDLSRDIIDGVRSGAVTYEQGQKMLGLGDKEYHKPQELDDGSVISVNQNDPTDVVVIKPGGESEQLSDSDRFERTRQVLNDFTDDLYPDAPQRGALAVARATTAEAANVLDLTKQSARGVMYNAERFTNNMGKDAGLLWFDKDTQNVTSYTPAILAMSAGYSPDNARQGVEEMLNPIRTAAGRRLNQNELRTLGNAVAKSVAANPRSSNGKAAASELAKLIEGQGVDSVLQELRANNVGSN